MNLVDGNPIASTSVVRVERVSKTYRQNSAEVAALHDVSLEIRSGEFLALVGPSGSGKTTLLNLIGALDIATAGEIRVGDTSLSGAAASRLAELRLRHIGFVFQDYNLIPVLSALENVEYVLLLQGVPAKERRSRAIEALVQLGLEGHEHRRPSQLSGGQQQRVAIARAIVSRPALVLADEPTANLDSATGDALLGTMQALNRELGTTFVFSTHDPRVMQRASRIIHLRDGRIVEGDGHAVH